MNKDCNSLLINFKDKEYAFCIRSHRSPNGRSIYIWLHPHLDNEAVLELTNGSRILVIYHYLRNEFIIESISLNQNPLLKEVFICYLKSFAEENLTVNSDN